MRADFPPDIPRVHLKENFGVYILGPDDVEFRTGTISGTCFVATDSEQRGLLGSIIERLFSLSPFPLRPWNQSETDLLSDLIPQLRERGILEPSESDPPLQTAANPFSLIEKPLGSARFKIIGHGILGRTLQAILQPISQQPIALIESNSVSPLSSSEFLRVSKDANASSWPPPTSDSSWNSLLADADWTIAAQDAFEPEELVSLNKAALETGRPWSLVCFDGYEGWIGPTFIPGQTACFGCFRKRLYAGASEPKHLFADPGTRVYRIPVPWSVGPETSAWVSLVASLFVLQLSGVVSGYFSPDFLIVHRLNLTFQRETVLRLPRCPDCSSRRDAPAINPFSQILSTRAFTTNAP